MEDEYLVLDPRLAKKESVVNLKVEKLESVRDVDKVLNLLRQGFVVFLRIKELRERSLSDLKRAVEKIKRTCEAIEGDIIGVDEDFIIVTPKNVRIFR